MENLSRSLANLSFPIETLENRNRSSPSQQAGFNIPSRAAFPLYSHPIWALSQIEKDQIFTYSSIDQEPQQTPAENAFFNFATNPEGSIKLQKMIMDGNPCVTSEVLKRVNSQVSGTPLLYFLMIDPYGSFVCSKLFDSCDELQLRSLVENIVIDTKILIDLLTDSQGSKSMKKLIKSLKGTSHSSLIVLRLSALFNRVMTNPTGSYIVNFCLDSLDLKEITPLYEKAISQCLFLATDKIGCVSLNNVVDRIQGNHRQQLLELISRNAVFLSQDPYGNHVVQKVLELENPVFSDVIGLMLKGHYVKLSMQKWGSHVVEKCLKSETAMEYGVLDFLTCGSKQLVQVARDQFGNYVIRKALELTKERNPFLHRKLVKSLSEQLSALSFGYGRNIYNLVLTENLCRFCYCL